MEKILQVLARLASLLEQYDNAENGIAQLEMQNEGLYRMTSEFEKDVSPVKGSINKTLKLITAQRDAFQRAIQDITGIAPAELRERLQELKVSIDHAGEYSLEEKKLHSVFDILVAAEAFGEEPGETRSDFETRLINLRKLKEFAMLHLAKLVDDTINKRTVVGATDSVLSLLRDRSVADTSLVLTI